ncbi:MAG: regulatory protein RecX [Flavobacteriales bacterium]
MEQDLKEKKAQTAGLARLQKWCGLRDRTEREVREKMREVMAKMATPPSASRAEVWSEDWMAALREDHYVDDARCAESYTRVHHEHKSWGPLKIKAGLASRGVSGSVADRAIHAIPEDQWQASANRLLARREDELETRQDRVIRWLMQRGFPQRMVWMALDHVTKTARREAGADS